MTVGSRIAERLQAVGLSQAELARRVGVHQSTMNGLIRGSAQGSRYLHKIARALRTTPAYLMGETDDPDAEFAESAVTAEEEEWLDQLRIVTPADRAAILQLTRSLAKCEAGPKPTLHSPSHEFRRTGTDG